MKKIALMLLGIALFGVLIAEAQVKSITGTVTSSDDGSGIPGVSVNVKGTTIGTVTNLSGEYLLDVPEDAKILVFSFIGMATQEVEITKNVIDVEMKTSSVDVDEVMVVAYGTSTKGSFTGSAGVVKAEELGKRQVSDVSNALAGSVAGVQTLSSNGQPGTSSSVRVRGVGSINAGKNPLYVVDGVPFDGDLSSISTSDIESMTVLKDAASTALYGARGANGIIIITTKKGEKGKAKINFDAKFGSNSRMITNYDVLTSPKNYTETAYQAIYNAAYYNLDYSSIDANAYANSVITSTSSGGYGYQIYTVPEGEVLIGTNGSLNPNATLGYSDGEYYYTPDDWADETFQNNIRQEYNLSISGGTDKSDYFISLNYLEDEGIISNSGFERFSGRFKGDHQLKDWLKVGVNVNYNNITSKYPSSQTSTTSSANAFFIANFIAPVYPVYVRDADTQQIMTNGDRKVYDYGDGASTNQTRSFMVLANPVGDLIYNKRNYYMDIVNSNFYAEISPVTGLKLTAKYGMNVDNTRRYTMGNAYMGQTSSYGGYSSQYNSRTYGFDQQYIADYKFPMNGEHQLDMMVGYDGYTYTYEYTYAYAENLYDPESYYLSNAIDNPDVAGEKDTYVTKGIFSRLNYSYNEKYFANIAYRRDASSRFSSDNRWGDFWSASAAWMISDENFMTISWIDMLKIKASLGQQGNDAIGNYYAYTDQYTVSGSEGVFSVTLDYKGNEDLTWETSTSYNVGVEYALFGDKLSGTIEYFGRKSSDMLYYKPVANSLGYSQIPMNIGSMTNSGVEFDVNYSILNTNDIKLSVNANATFLKNKINELHPDLEGELIDGSRIYEEGESMYRYYLVEWAGVDSETGKALYYAEEDDGSRYTTDDWSEAADYKVATDDLLPTVYGGFGVSVEAYGFDASIQCSYQLGGEIYDSGYQRLMHGGTSSYAGNNWHKDIYKAWTEENTNTDVPRLDANDQYANSTSTRWVTSSDYLCINNITVGYSLPSRLIKKIKLEKCRIYFVADNVALFSARKGLDPRQSYTSSTTAVYTPIRTLSGGVNLSF